MLTQANCPCPVNDCPSLAAYDLTNNFAVSKGPQEHVGRTPCTANTLGNSALARELRTFVMSRAWTPRNLEPA
eukprot:3540725-Lingulodinium_polyedra.AAC.1